MDHDSSTFAENNSRIILPKEGIQSLPNICWLLFWYGLFIDFHEAIACSWIFN